MHVLVLCEEQWFFDSQNGDLRQLESEERSQYGLRCLCGLQPYQERRITLRLLVVAAYDKMKSYVRFQLKSLDKGAARISPISVDRMRMST